MSFDRCPKLSWQVVDGIIGDAAMAAHLQVMAVAPRRASMVLEAMATGNATVLERLFYLGHAVTSA
jgi:hypothetical protein